MRKSKVYEFISNFLYMVLWVLFIVGLLLVYRFFFVILPGGGSKLQSIGQIGLAAFGMWWLLGIIDDLDEAEDKALDAEYKQVVYSGLLAHREDKQDE